MMRLLVTILVFINISSFVLIPARDLEKENEKISWQESLASSILSLNPNFLPIRNWAINEPEIEARSAIIYLISGNEDKETGLPDYKGIRREKVLYEKHKTWVLPIASLTKLMTAVIAIENMELEESVVISQKAIDTYGYRGNLRIDEKITVKNLLYALLLESSNDAATALAEHYGQGQEELFIELMNKKAKRLGLENTFFTDAAGLDSTNVSTVEEIVELIEYSLRYPLLWQILKTPNITISSVDRKVQHYLINTDVLLNRLPNVLGGKTGYTDEAQGCFVVVIEQSPAEYLISAVLGADKKFLQTEKLINWVDRAYKWQ